MQDQEKSLSFIDQKSCAIIGRMSAYTGRAIIWDWTMNSSQLDLTPPSYEFGDVPVAAVAIPGKTPLI